MERPSIKRPEGLNKLHLLDEHLLGIGYVAVRAGQFDTGVEFTISDTARGWATTMEKSICALSVPKKIDLIGEWLIRDLPQWEQEVQQFVSTVHATRSERDDVIHRSWHKTDKDDVKQLFDHRLPGPKALKRQVTPQYLLDLGERFLGLSDKMSDLQGRAFQALLASQSQPPDKSLLPPQPVTSFSAMTQAAYRIALFRALKEHPPSGTSKS